MQSKGKSQTSCDWLMKQAKLMKNLDYFLDIVMCMGQEYK